MFFILSKALLFILSPFFWIVVSLIAYFWFRQPKWKKRALITSICLFLFFTNTAIFLTFCNMWEVPGTPIEKVKKHDVGIVLSGMAEYDNSLQRLSIRRSGDRIWQAITLYQTGKIDKMLITGESGYISERGLKEAQQFKELLVKWGIPESDILTEEVSKNTHENAAESKKVLNEYPELKSYLLITSGTHMRRSLACFEHEGLKSTPFSTDLYTSENQHFFWDQYIVPDVSNFDSWNKLIKEWVGYISYWMVGYI